MKLLEEHRTPSSKPAGAKTRAIVEQELNRILESDSFRESKRCQEFLRHVVTLTLEGRTEEIKERAIGIDVFGRAAAYSTNDDSIVRVKASEIRKRLAQYHLLRHADQKVKIDLSSGSYVPEISWIAPPPEEPVPEPRRTFGRRWIAWLAAVALIAAAAALFLLRPAQNGHARFWGPVLRNQDPVLICLAHPVVYLLSKRLHDQYRAERAGAMEPGPYVIPLKPGYVDAQDIVPVPDQYVGVGDSVASVLLSNMLTRMGRASQTRIGNDVSFSELRHSTVILVGAYSNRWTMQLTGELRYVFDLHDGNKVIRDRAAPERTWAPPVMGAAGKVTEDYAIVSRVFEPKSGQIVVSAAGITQYGSQAAAEFLSRPEYLDRAVDGLPSGWPKKNLQFVIRAKVLGSSVASPEVAAQHAW
jgi:hypothetical protein